MDPQVPTLDLTHAPADPPAPPEMPQTPKDNHWITILAMALFVLGSLAVVVFLYYQNQQLKTMLASYQASPTPTASQAPNDDLAKWKTYTDSKQTFSFRYPENSLIKSDSLNVDGSIEFNNFILLREKTGSTLSNYVDRLKDTSSTFKPQEKSIGALSTIEWVGFYKNAPTYYVSILNGGYVYSFGLTPYDNASDHTAATNLFDQILSTFKFLGTSPIPSSSPILSSPLPQY